MNKIFSGIASTAGSSPVVGVSGIAGLRKEWGEEFPIDAPNYIPCGSHRKVLGGNVPGCPDDWVTDRITCRDWL